MIQRAATPDTGSRDTGTRASLPAHAEVVIVGTGFSGLGAAIRLRQAGIDDLVVLERSDDLGGTWRDNTYPGAACDVPSRLYSFSFALNPDWTHSYSRQPEILDYLRACADEHGVREHIWFGHELLDARWDPDTRRWVIETSRGSMTAGSLVAGSGALVEPARPHLPGLETFAGEVFHSARWNHGHDLTGARVAVIGTGASAIQFVPRIAPTVARLHLFQRTPPWVTPRADRRISRLERWIYRRVPGANRLARAGVYALMESRALGFVGDHRLRRIFEAAARTHLARQVPDRALREKLTPRYTIGCKRILVSNDYYPALLRPQVDLVTDPIAAIEPAGVRTAAGRLHEVDTLILGTGFRVTDNPGFSRIRGPDGTSLEQAWAATGMRAYLGTMVAGFPNLYLLLGPNTGLGHNSVVYMIESQIELVVACLRHLRARGATSLAVRPQVEAAFNAELARRSARTVWNSGCESWYLDSAGRNTVLWPDMSWRFRRWTRRFEPADYLVDEPAPEARLPEASCPAAPQPTQGDRPSSDGAPVNLPGPAH